MSLRSVKNLIKLDGYRYCNEENENIVVYEHASNGRLDKHLGNPCLTWKQRVQICIDIAHGLKFLHEFDVHDEDSLKHRDIKSGSVLLDGDWNAKISNFEMSMKAHVDDDNWHSMGYVDPQYQSCGYLALWSDVYSLGVICIEMLCGRLAWIKGSCVDHSQSLGPLAIRQYKEKGNIDEMIFEGINEQISPQSLTEFLKICTQCLENDPDDRPHLDDVIKQLKKALEFQDNNPQISVKAIKLGTQDFSDCNCVGEGRLWKLYKGEGEHTNGCTAFVVKRWNRESDQGQIQFSTELDILSRYKHENIIGLVGYCKEEKEKIIVYEYASNGTLDKHLGNSSLTWRKRLQIALDIANGLACLHSGNEKREDFMVHRDIKSGNILLDGDWHAKIVNLELSCKSGILKKATHVDENDYDSLGYIDPIYRTKGFLTQKSDIYSLGVILVEMLYGKLTWAKGWENYCQSLGVFATTHYTEKENFQEMIIKAIEEQIAPQEMIFEAIKEQTAPRSLTRFLQIIVRCFDEKEYRLGANEVIKQLEKALKFQDDYEWEMKLPIDYKEIIRASEYPEYYGIIEMKRELYDVFIKGVYLRDHKTVKNEEINSHCEIEPLDKQLCLNEDNGRKKHVMLSAAEVLFGSSNVNNVKHFVYRKPSLKSSSAIRASCAQHVRT
ncbi:hypothetical protein QVD17_03217 [Tagetes erecta]|uniref:Protein kinase domain-containing protein n=1 Tax=Tagetes erecta TaxID=13708 RepID=A0AAD8LE57_TARER|nr:hypothetical protein QVD17_03217 [Tagetes erecta]